MVKGVLLSLALLCCNISIARNDSFPCPLMLTTSFGYEGSLTATISPKGDVTFWRDGFVVENAQRVAQFEVEESTRIQSIVNDFRAVASQSQLSVSRGYFGLIDERRDLKVVTPLEQTYDIKLPRNIRANTIDIYARPLRLSEHEMLQSPALIFANQRELRREFKEKAKEALIDRSVLFYFSSGVDFYRIRFKRIKFNQKHDKQVQGYLAEGLTRATLEETTESESGRKKYSISASKSALRYLDYTINRPDWGYLLPTTESDSAILVSAIEKVSTLQDIEQTETINFMKVLNPNRAVIATETGIVRIVDLPTGKTVADLKIPAVTWIKSVSAHVIDNRVHIWVVNAVDKSLYYWDEEQVPFSYNFKKLEGLPDGVLPSKIATFAEPVPLSAKLGANASESDYFTNLRYLDEERSYFERILLLGEDQNLYGYVRDTSIGSLGEYRWEKQAYNQN